MLYAVKSEPNGSPLGSLQKIKNENSQKSLTELLSKLKDSKEKASDIEVKQKLSRRDYPELVELKLAGKSEDEIARKLGVGKQEVKIHSSKAMADFRAGKIKINAGNSIMEAREDAKNMASATVSATEPSNTDGSVSASLSITI